MMLPLEPDVRNTPEARASRARLLDFRVEKDRLAGMPTLALLYPRIALARACDPREVAGEDDVQERSCDAALAWAETRVRKLLPVLGRRESVSQRSVEAIDGTLHPYTWQNGSPDTSTADGVLHHAYHGTFHALEHQTAQGLVVAELQWAQLHLAIDLAEQHPTPSARRFIATCRGTLEFCRDRSRPKRRLEAAGMTRAGTGPHRSSSISSPTPRRHVAGGRRVDSPASGPARRRTSRRHRGWEQHVELTRTLATTGLDRGRPPEDLAHVLVLQGLAAPGVAALRALKRAGVGGSLEDVHARNAAAHVAWGFRALFNVPEVVALVRSDAPEDPYSQRILRYCLEGNSPAMFDEYGHVLVEQSRAGRQVQRRGHGGTGR